MTALTLPLLTHWLACLYALVALLYGVGGDVFTLDFYGASAMLYYLTAEFLGWCEQPPRRRR